MKFALIKKTEFRFSNLMHTALVSTSGTREELFIHVQLINSFLRTLFGVEHIRFWRCNGEIRLQQAGHPFVYQVAELISSELNKEWEDAPGNHLRAV